MNNSITFTSYFTAGTPYEKEIRPLVASLKEFKLRFKIYSVRNQGTWADNVFLKPKVILRCRNEIDGPIVFLDADSTILQYPEFFDNLKCDVSFHERNRDGYSIPSGTLYFGDTPIVRDFLTDWDNRCQKKEKILPRECDPPYHKVNTDRWNSFDQGCLVNTYFSFRDMGKELHVEQLPKSYIVKEGSHHIPQIILHRRASRKYRRTSM